MADSKPELTLNRMDSLKARDLQGPDNSIPLSPQWLLPKPGENKLAATAGDHPVNCSPNHGSRNEFVAKASGEESFDTEKRKDVWRSASVEAENIRREHWRDEERESTGVRRDRWREGEKDLGDHRRSDRWGDNLLGRSPGEMRRLPLDRWNETGNRETGYDMRRESKWDTRWGREEKDLENRRDKWLESGKDGEGQREKGVPISSDNAKDSERESEHNSRPWRSNSLQNRARGEASFLQTPTPNKSAQGFGLGRGRGDSRGRGSYTCSGSIPNYSNFSHLGAPSERWDVNLGNGTTLKYSRAKILDIYRKCGTKPFSRLPDGFAEVPLLTQIEALEPLALSSPSAEEEAMIEGIDRGDIVSSGVPQFSKDGTQNRNRDDGVHSRRQRPGIRGDGTSTIDSYREENSSNSKVGNSNYKEIDIIDKNTDLSSRDLKTGEFHERQPFQDGSMDADGSKDEELLHKHRIDLRKSYKDFCQDNSGSISGSGTSRYPTKELQGPLYDRQDIKSEIPSKGSDAKDMVWGRSVVGRDHNNHEIQVTEKVDSREVSMGWHMNEVLQDDPSRLKYESITGRHIPLEELSLIYKDPQGDIQGPFSGADMIGWFEAGYFGIDLPVRLQSAPVDAPFRSLGDVMPHLRMKARAPPGFGTPKQGDFTDSTNENKFSTPGKIHIQANITGSGFELPMNEQKSKMDARASEKRFLESLMNHTFKNPQPEPLEGGSIGFQSLSPGRTPSIGAESGLDINYTIGQRMPPYHSVERQKSLPNPYTYIWSGGDSSSLATSSEIDTGALHTMSHGNEHGDIISLLHGASDSGVSPVNKSAKSWANYGDVQTRGSIGHSVLDIPPQDQLDMHHLQRFSPVQSGFALQHQRQQQHQPHMQHLMLPPMETNPGGMPLDQLLPSGLPQDPQTLNLFHQQQQQQLLLSQLQLRSQASLSSQVSLLDQLLILKQQKQQQQQLLPQVLLEQITQQRLQEASYDRAQASGSLGNNSADHLIFRQHSDPFMTNVKLPQHVPSPQTSVVDNLVHLLNQQEASKGTSSSQQVQMEENFKHNQVAPSTLQQTSFRESQPSPVWGLAEQDGHAKLQTSSVSPSSETVSKEQQLSLQLEKGSCSTSGLNTLLLSSDNFQVVPQVEQVSTESLLPRVVDDATPIENHVVVVEPSTSYVSDMSVDHVPEKVIHEKKMNQNELKKSITVSPEESSFQEKPVGDETFTAKEMSVTETREVKKGSDKKKKQKNSKSPFERQKGQSELHSRQQVKQEVENLRAVTQSLSLEENNCSDIQIPVSQSSVSQTLHAPMAASFSEESPMIDRTTMVDVESLSRSQGPSSLSQRAWKPAACPKPKSLLEIQQEEQQQKSKSEKVVPEIPVLSTPTALPTTGSGSWAGAISGSEKLPKDVQLNVNAAAASVLRSVSGNLDSSSSVKSKKSQLHDLLAEEVLAKTSPQISEPSGADNVENPSALLSTSVAFLTPESLTVDDNEFVEAKETRKNRKRGTKGKNSAAGKTTPVVPFEAPVPSTPVEKSKSSRQVQQDKEVFPVPPSGPSLGDFLPWKAESSSSPPAPAWSASTPKLTKTASLRDIQKEQERKQPIPVQPFQQVISVPKVQASRSSSGNSTLLSLAKSPTPTQSIPIPSNTSRSKPEEELFWGPVNQPKEAEQPEFPSLLTGKKSTPKSSMGKTPSGLSSQQKSGGFFTSNKSPDISSSSASASAKEKKQLANKHSEAKDFYGWCEAELCKLIGNNDTHFLEFCMKQSTSEAEILLVQNLGSFDPERDFIDKVLKYKELLPADIIEMAFSYRDVHSQSVRNVQSQDANTSDNKSGSGRDLDNIAIANDLDFSAKGGKKKGKKGRKLNPAVLGFSVESTTRIMKGEIQIVDD